jgi:hypothetical protein
MSYPNVLTTIDVDAETEYRRDVYGAGTGALSLPGLTIHSKDPDELERFALELSSLAESMRLARLAQFRTAS